MRILLDLKCVATLPCEISVPANSRVSLRHYVYTIFSKNWIYKELSETLVKVSQVHR